jgi:hypothetical protein
MNERFEELERRAHALRCMALLTGEQIDVVLCDGVRWPSNKDFVYVGAQTRELISYSVADVIEKAEALAKEIEVIFKEWRERHERHA